MSNAPALLTGLEILDNEAPNGGGIYVTTAFGSGGADVAESVISGCVAQWGGGVLNLGSNQYRNCTIVDCKAYLGAGLFNLAYHDYPSAARLEQCIIAFNEGAGVFPELALREGVLPALSCCDVYANSGGNYGNGMSDPTGVDGNISADPLFCSMADHDYRLSSSSPCIVGNHPDGAACGLIGAEDSVCELPAVQETSFGHIKSLY